MLVRGSRYGGTKQVREKIIYRGLVIDLLFETARIAPGPEGNSQS